MMGLTSASDPRESHEPDVGSGLSGKFASVEDAEVERRLDLAAEESEAIGPVLEAYRGRVERMLRLRMDPRVMGRVGVSDVMQDAFLEIAKRLPNYLEHRHEWRDKEQPGEARPGGPGPARFPASAPASAPAAGADSPQRHQAGAERGPMPFFPWVRFIATQALAQVHRTHLGTLARDAGRDLPLEGGMWAGQGASSMMLASALLQSGISPSGAAALEEQREMLSEALAELPEGDREILFLRHFEQLSNREVAAVLGLARSGASVRHLKALKRLQHALGRCGMSFDPEGGVRISADPPGPGSSK